MEAKLRSIIRGLPGPEAVPQFQVDTEQGRFFLDFAYPEIKLGIEAQSIRWHLGEARFFYDLRRDRALKRVGWTLIYYSWDDLLRPIPVREEISSFRRNLRPVLI